MKLKKVILSSILGLAILAPTPALANLTQCLTSKATEQDHISLVKWVFSAIAQHPELKQYSNISTDDQKAIDKAVGASLDRLLTVDCKNELISAAKNDPRSVAQSFSVLGQVAMGSLMTNPEVAKAAANMPNLLDMKKLEALVK